MRLASKISIYINFKGPLKETVNSDSVGWASVYLDTTSHLQELLFQDMSKSLIALGRYRWSHLVYKVLLWLRGMWSSSSVLPWNNKEAKRVWRMCRSAWRPTCTGINVSEILQLTFQFFFLLRSKGGRDSSAHSFIVYSKKRIASATARLAHAENSAQRSQILQPSARSPFKFYTAERRPENLGRTTRLTSQ